MTGVPYHGASTLVTVRYSSLPEARTHSPTTGDCSRGGDGAIPERRWGPNLEP
jgi:hypothetical protein